MIDMEFYITNPSNSPSGTSMNRPRAAVPPQFDLLGQFLTVELNRSHTPLFKSLPKLMRQVESGELDKYDGGGEGHWLVVTPDAATIETMYADPQQQLTLEFGDFKNAVERWMTFVKEYPSARGNLTPRNRDD